MTGFFDTFDIIPPPYPSQQTTTQFILDNCESGCYVMNVPGTGKTRAALDALVHLKEKHNARALVLAPKTILEPAWAADAKRFTPELRFSVAYAKNRAKAFNTEADVYITNHDATNWLSKHPRVIDSQFPWAIVIDEATAFKNRSANRSKALRQIIDRFSWRVLMSGTPMPQGLDDIWHQALLMDRGERLGASYYRFRAATHESINTPFATEWIEKDGAREVVADLLADVTIRFELEDVPEQVMRPALVHAIPPKLREQYDMMAKQALLELDSTEHEVTAVHAAAKLTKLLQIASGAVYGAGGTYHTLDETRNNLIAQLCCEREHSLVAFLWRHQRDGLAQALKAAGIRDFAVLDGSTKGSKVNQIVQDYQRGAYRVLLAHPQSAGHGLTLTRGTTTIWAAPIFNGELFAQFNKRQHRAGQTKETEVICVAAEDTVDLAAYDRLRYKLDTQADMIALLQSLRTGAGS